MTVVTISWLLQHGACRGQVDNFHRCFGNSMEVTRENLTKAVDAGLNLNWFARKCGWRDFQFKEFDRRAVDVFLATIQARSAVHP